MGGCLSSSSAAIESNHGRSSKSRSSSAAAAAAANVISANGDLHQYPVPVTVSQVLEMEFPTPSSPAKFFICNSDRLYYDDFIPAMDGKDFLQADQIYFVLPSSRLQYRLTASDMAALAVKASLSLQKSSSSTSSSSSFSHRHRRQGQSQNKAAARISPILEDPNKSSPSSSDMITTSQMTIRKGISNKLPETTAAGGGGGAVGVSRTGSMRKLQRYSSKRAMMAVRSFRIRLTTIQE